LLPTTTTIIIIIIIQSPDGGIILPGSRCNESRAANNVFRLAQTQAVVGQVLSDQ
jgi:hypothetical protein